jgi:large subunit ribosomal protein L31
MSVDVTPGRWRRLGLTNSGRKNKAMGPECSPRPLPLATAGRLRYNRARLSRSYVMKPKIHPEYHEINVVMTDGSKFTTRSTYGKPGETLHLDIDPKSHPAWTGVHRLMDSGGQLAKFNKRFQGMSMKKK